MWSVKIEFQPSIDQLIEPPKMASKLVLEILIKRYGYFQFLIRFQPRKKNQIAAANRVPKKLFFDTEKIRKLEFQLQKVWTVQVEFQPRM